MKRSLRTLILTVACVMLLAVNPARAELPVVSDAHIIQPPPGAKVAAAYFTLTNTGKSALTVSDVTSNAAKKTELHLSKVENDVAKMIKQDSIIIKAGESLEFKQGSYHVMFMGLAHPLVSGKSLDIVLQTSAGKLPISIPVISSDRISAK